MRFSLKTEYGLRAVLYLAVRWGQPGVPAREIARAEGIPQRFLEQQVTALRKAGVVQSQRGPAGGCRLARHPRGITVLEVVEALEGPLLAREPEAPARAPTPSKAAVAELFAELARVLDERLASMTLAELAARQQELSAGRSDMFYI